MRILAIDPGFKESGWLLCDADPFEIRDMGITPNDDVRSRCKHERFDVVVIEHISMGGMIAGQETFDTCFEAGRFAEAALPVPFALLKRIKVKLHLCGQARAKDSNVRQALIDRFGGSEAIGKKKTPGPLYGVKAHIWAALALAVTYSDTQGIMGHAPQRDLPGVAGGRGVLDRLPPAVPADVDSAQHDPPDCGRVAGDDGFGT